MASDYQALCTIEKAMENSISFVSFESERFTDYVRDMCRSKNDAAGCFKLLMMTEERALKHAKRREAKICAMEMELLYMAVKYPRYREWYPWIDFEQPLPAPVLKRLKRRSQSFWKQYDRIWSWWLALSILAGCLLIAFLVLALRLNYWFSLVFTLALIAGSAVYGWYEGVYRILQSGVQQTEVSLDSLTKKFLLHVRSARK